MCTVYAFMSVLLILNVCVYNMFTHLFTVSLVSLCIHDCVCDCLWMCASTSAELIPRVTSVNEAWWELGVSRSADRRISFQCQTPSLSVSETLFSHASALSLPIHQILFFFPQLIHLPAPRLFKPPSSLPHYAQITSLTPSSGVELFLSSATCESIIILNY